MNLKMQILKWLGRLITEPESLPGSGIRNHFQKGNNRFHVFHFKCVDILFCFLSSQTKLLSCMDKSELSIIICE